MYKQRESMNAKWNMKIMKNYAKVIRKQCSSTDAHL